MLINTAGGMAGGDRFAIDIAAGPGARVVVTTAAAEKVYRALDPAATVDVRLTVGPGAALAWLPQETILFDRAKLRRSIEIDLADDARLLLAEAIVFGRSGMGEAVEECELSDRWRLRRGGRLVHAEALRLDGAVAAKLGRPAVANGGIAVATVLLAPGDDSSGGRGARAGGTIPRRGRRLGLERLGDRAVVRHRRRRAAPRSRPGAGGAARRAAAAPLAQLIGMQQHGG